MTTVNYVMGDIVVDGIEGVFSQTKRGSFARIHHCVPNDNGIGCKQYDFVASVPLGTYGDARENIRPKNNDQYEQMVVDAINRYISRMNNLPQTAK